jgi:hypothetical protein
MESTKVVTDSRSAVRWGSVLAGTVIGIGLMALLTRLWVALAWSGIASAPATVNVASVADNIEWYLAASAAFAALTAGFFSAWLSSSRGWGPGVLNALTAWSLTTVATLAMGAPSVVAFVVGSTIILDLTTLWATFWGMLLGLVLALCGGALGGATKHPNALFAPHSLEVTEIEEDLDAGTVIRARSIRLTEAEANAL